MSEAAAAAIDDVLQAALDDPAAEQLWAQVEQAWERMSWHQRHRVEARMRRRARQLRGAISRMRAELDVLDARHARLAAAIGDLDIGWEKVHAERARLDDAKRYLDARRRRLETDRVRVAAEAELLELSRPQDRQLRGPAMYSPEVQRAVDTEERRRHAADDVSRWHGRPARSTTRRAS